MAAATDSDHTRKCFTVCHSERLTLLQRIKSNNRRYARTAGEYRRQTLHFGNELGTCFVSIGETQVFARTIITPREPDVAHPKRGFVQFEISFDRCAERWLLEDLSIADVRQGIRRALGSIVASQAIDADTLCICAGKLVWHVLTQITILYFDGNVNDAALLATMGAMLHARHPLAKVEEGGKVRVLSEQEHAQVPLHIFHIPIATTYSLFRVADVSAKGSYTTTAIEATSTANNMRLAPKELIVAVDADARETLIAEGSVTFIINKYGQVCSLYTMGCATLVTQQEDEFLEKLCQAATKRAIFLHNTLRAQVDKSHERLSKWRIDFYKGFNATMVPEKPDEVLELYSETSNAAETDDSEQALNKTVLLSDAGGGGALPYSYAGPRRAFLKLMTKSAAKKVTVIKAEPSGAGAAAVAAAVGAEKQAANTAVSAREFWTLDALPAQVATAAAPVAENDDVKKEEESTDEDEDDEDEDETEEDEDESSAAMDEEAVKDDDDSDKSSASEVDENY